MLLVSAPFAHKCSGFATHHVVLAEVSPQANHELYRAKRSQMVPTCANML